MVSLRPDAGFTTAAVIIPKAMAYAAIAGLPLVVGLFTSLVMLVMCAALGTSRLLSVTTSSTIAILASSALGAVAPGGNVATLLSASATLSLLVGAFLLLVAMNPSVLEVIKLSPLWERLGDERIFFMLDQAVERFQRQTAEDS